MSVKLISKPDFRVWERVAGLFSQAIPNAMISSLGNHAGALYYSYLANKFKSSVYVAIDESGEVAGAIIGLLEFNAEHSMPLLFKIKLLCAANVRLLSPYFICWICKGMLEKAKSLQAVDYQAKLKVIAISPEFKGQGLAKRLVDKMEFDLISNSFNSYQILTETENDRANAFYAKTGAKLVGSYFHHGREINEWVKELC